MKAIYDIAFSSRILKYSRFITIYLWWGSFIPDAAIIGRFLVEFFKNPKKMRFWLKQKKKAINSVHFPYFWYGLSWFFRMNVKSHLCFMMPTRVSSVLLSRGFKAFWEYHLLHILSADESVNLRFERSRYVKIFIFTFGGEF